MIANHDEFYFCNIGIPAEVIILQQSGWSNKDGGTRSARCSEFDLECVLEGGITWLQHEIFRFLKEESEKFVCIEFLDTISLL